MERRSGVTLIELLIAVAIIGVLAAIAYPSFLDQLRKSRRAEAKSALLNIAGRQQQFLLDTRRYASTLAELGVDVPASVAPFYSITLSVSNMTSTLCSFTATAAPLGTQADDACASLSIDQTGSKAPGACW
jgi:type IV pilus assembly protein PilE